MIVPFCYCYRYLLDFLFIMASVSALHDSLFFLEYEKMSEDSSEWKSRDLHKIPKWVVLEKVHGANLAFYISSFGALKVAKRSSFLSSEDYFFGFWNSRIISDISPKLPKLFEHVRQLYPSMLQLSLHGELFGGMYTHSDVCKSTLHIQSIQSSVMYSSELQFIVFDIAIYITTEDRVYLDYDYVIDLCERFTILCCRPLYCGKLAQAENFDLNYQTTLPAMFSLPKILNRSNFAEGIVIKPLKTISLITTKGLRRVIYKRKHPNFLEKKARYTAQPSFSFRSVHDESTLIAKYELLSLINSNRIQSAISKNGFPNEQDQILVIKRLIIDEIFEEYCRDNSVEFSALTEGTITYLRVVAEEEITTLMKDEFRL